MSIYILLQINFAINNNNKSLPSFTIQFQFQYSTRHFLTEVGSQGWKGAQKAAAAAWDRGEGLWLMGVTSQGHTQVCLPFKPTFLTCREAQTGTLDPHGYHVGSAQRWWWGETRILHRRQEPWRALLGHWESAQGSLGTYHTPDPQPQVDACPAYPISGSQDPLNCKVGGEQMQDLHHEHLSRMCMDGS